MNRNINRYEELQPSRQQHAIVSNSKDHPDSLENDLKLSDTAFNDLFSEFDTPAHDFQCFHAPAADDAHGSRPNIDELLSSNTIKFLIEQHQSQHTAMEPLSHLSDRVTQPTREHEPISVTMDQFQALISATHSRSNSTTNAISTLLENSTIIGNNIPLKIVNPTGQALVYTASEGLDSPVHASTGGTRRRSTHNAIEKRYRSSINERIHELKDIVAPNDEKIQKSGILRRTVEFIRQLQSTNRRLEDENGTLKLFLHRFNVTNVESTSHSHARPSTKSSTTTPPSSTISDHSDESSLGSSDEVGSPEPKRKRTNSKRGMVNGSRLLLCCFMVCVLITNPFNYLLDRIHSSSSANAIELPSSFSSRTLKSIVDKEPLSSSVYLGLSCKQVIGWMLNLAICLVCLVKIFVHGDPIVHESDMEEYYAYRKKADCLMEENQWHDARVYYRQCCDKLYVSMDNTTLSYLLSLTWQLIRFGLNLMFVGRWLTYWSGWTKSIDTRDYNRELNHCLLQLWRIEYHSSASLLNLLNLFLSTINTSTNTGKKLDLNTRNEVYLLSALTLTRLDGLGSILIPYLLKLLVPMDVNEIWFLDADRLHQFINEKPVDVFKANSLVESIRGQYAQYILFDDIENHLLFQDKQEIVVRSEQEFDRYFWWQHCLQVIRCISNEKQHIHRVTSEHTIYQRARTQQVVDERYIVAMENIHNILLDLTDDEDQTNGTRLLKQLGHSSRLLISMMTCNCNQHEDPLDLAIKTLLFDGILALRLRLMTSTMADHHQSTPYLDDFQRELDFYKPLHQSMKLPKQRFYLFESIFRASSGLNPLATQTLFERALKDPHSNAKDESSPNLDIIAALLLFCHYLPSTVYRYRKLLQRAVAISSTTNENNDLHRLQQQCLKLIRQPFFTL